MEVNGLRACFHYLEFDCCLEMMCRGVQGLSVGALALSNPAWPVK